MDPAGVWTDVVHVHHADHPERTEVDLGATGRDGTVPVPADSHVRPAHPTTNGGVRMLRRGYPFSDGNDALLG